MVWLEHSGTMVVQTEAGIPKRSCEREAEVNKMEISMVELLTVAGKKKKQKQKVK